MQYAVYTIERRKRLDRYRGVTLAWIAVSINKHIIEVICFESFENIYGFNLGSMN